jgi:hypothetical protein
MNWVTREDTCTNRSRAEVTPVIIKGANLKGAIRNRKVQKKAQKRRPQYHSSSHTKKKKTKGVQKDRLPFQTHSSEWGFRSEEEITNSHS